MINFNIGTFFDKFKNSALREMNSRQVIADVIEKISGVKLDPIKEVELKNKIIHIKASAAAKNHIFIKKEAILTEVRSLFPGFIIEDIR